MTREAIIGSILGTAVGDAIGLPYEGLTKRRGARLWGKPDRHHLVFGRGMVSDDTEHTCMVAQALIASGGEPERFAKRLAWGLRWWLLSLPAGIGLATLRACLKLWCGFPPGRSGVFSAGNGPAMRSAVLGAAVDELEQLRVLVGVCTRITHTDPKALHGALAVALAARFARQSEHIDAATYLTLLRQCLVDAEPFVALIERAAHSARAGESTEVFAASLGHNQAVSGYVYDTVPVAIHAWLRHPHDFETAIQAAVQCGGDTDTVAAIVGGIVGAGVTKRGIPARWLNRLCEWPRTVRWMEHLGATVALSAGGNSARVPQLSPLSVLARNAVLLLLVLLHLLRRALPPY